MGPGERALIPCGFRIAVPPGHEAQIRPRSGLAARYGLTILNAPGTIDEDYRGEIQVLLVNASRSSHTVHRGDRVAQMIVAPVVRATFDEVTALDETPRGAAGFGSTGR